jgi:tetratricopeptide (TPR) repeat protein
MHTSLRAAVIALLAGVLVRCASAPGPVTPSARELFAFRDPRAGAPVTATPRDEKLLVEGMGALSRGNPARARRAFASGARRSAAAQLFRLATAYVDLAEGRTDEASAAIDTLVAGAHGWTAALEARGDLGASRGFAREALDAYRKALKTLPRDPRLSERVVTIQAALSGALSDEAKSALERADLDAARRAGFGLLELDPEDPRGYRTLADAAASAARWDDAYSFAERARTLAPHDVDWTSRTAELAARSGRHGEAAHLYEALAAELPSAESKAEKERLAFKIQNLPEIARRAALSPKVTRAQLAAVAYWLVPEVREAPAPAGAEVATDVVDRFDRTELVRAIGLGLLPVSETHHAQPDAVLSRGELATFLQKLAGLVAQGRRLPSCLTPDASPASLAECGILGESSGRSTSGTDAVSAVERAVRAGREGATR